MADWFRKNLIIAVVNGLIVVITSIIGISVMRVVSAMDSKAEKIEVELQFENTETHIEALSIEIKSQNTYIDQQNTKQDEALEKRLAERDKINEIILNELSYIKKRVDKIPTK